MQAAHPNAPAGGGGHSAEFHQVLNMAKQSLTETASAASVAAVHTATNGITTLSETASAAVSSTVTSKSAYKAPEVVDHSPGNAVFFHAVQLFRQQTDGVVEQLDRIVDSPLNQSTIYFTEVGMQSVVCPDELNCKRLGTYDDAKTGTDIKTLGPLYEHCQSHPQHTVSFISSRNHPRLRSVSTKAVLSDACLRMNQWGCNLCGMHFSLAPLFHFAGNSWMATCQYVNQLLPPHEYTEAREPMCHEFRNKGDDFMCEDNPPGDETGPRAKDKRWGLGKFAMERWIMSHPSVHICKSFPLPMRFIHNAAEPWEPQLVAIPKLNHYSMFESQRQVVDYHMKEYYYFYGQHAPEGGICQQLFSEIRPNPCLDTQFHITNLLQQQRQREKQQQQQQMQPQ